MSAKKEHRPAGPVSVRDGLSSLLKAAEKYAATKGKMSRASEMVERYVDFVNISSPDGGPCILFEYLFSTKGLITGRVVKIDAEEATGKSSLLYLLYGMAQKSGGAYILNHESERALMPPDRIARLGCNPDTLMLYRPGDVDDCLNTTKQFIVNVRKDLDKGMKYPIYIGMDSVSGIAETELDPATGEPLDEKGKGLGYHARRFSKFFRDDLGYMAINQAVILGTGQSKTRFNTLPGGRQIAAGKTSLAEGTFKFHASWIVNMKQQKGPTPDSDVIVFSTEKNKMGPKRREIRMLLYRDSRGWDLDYGTMSLLTSSYSPIKDEFTTNGGGRYAHPAVGSGKSMDAEEFVKAFYMCPELLARCREAWMVRGYGFKFEEIDVPWEADEELMTEKQEEVADESTNKLR